VQLDATISSIRLHDTLLVLADLNSTMGKNRICFEAVVGRFSSGVDEPNENSLQMLFLCTSAGLAVIGSWFQRCDIHR